MGKPFLQIDFDGKFNNKYYKSLLNKLKTFIKYQATVGIHTSEGKKRMPHMYTNSKNKLTKSGKSYKMTLIKVAYQNEFGAIIPIKPRYRDAVRTVGSPEIIHTLKYRISRRTVEKYSKLRGTREQGYLLLSKTGKFVMYKKPGSVIHIPPRPFIRKVVTNPTKLMINSIQDILNKTFIRGGYPSYTAFKKIVEIVTYRMKNGLKNDQKPNHYVTVKAKGFNSPLTDEQDRIYKAIKYKIYKEGTKSFENIWLQKNMRTIDKLLKSSKQFVDKGYWGRKFSERVQEYKI